MSRYRKVRNAIGEFVNVGVGGDCVENVFWRVKNTRFNNNVRSIVIHCGTNNLTEHSPSKICDGLLEIGLYVRKNYPSIYLFISGILRRDGTSFAGRVAETNVYIRDMRSKFNIAFVDHSYWQDQSGNIREELFWIDGLHLNEQGSHKLAMEIKHAIYIKRIAGNNYFLNSVNLDVLGRSKQGVLKDTISYCGFEPPARYPPTSVTRVSLGSVPTLSRPFHAGKKILVDHRLDV